MKIAIVGSRDFKHLDAVREFVRMLPPGTVVVSGGARGVDKTAEDEANAWGLVVCSYHPDWGTGRGAGFARNKLIVDQADRVVAFWDGESRGTRDSIEKATKAGKDVLIWVWDQLLNMPAWWRGEHMDTAAEIATRKPEP